MIFIAILTGISIVLGMSYSNFIVASENHKVAEMYINKLKYSITINGSKIKAFTIGPEDVAIIEVSITSQNPIESYYKLVYKNNSNISVKYYESTQDTEGNITNYNSPGDKIPANGTNNIKLKIVNNSTSSQKVSFGIFGGFITNTLEDVIIASTATEIEKEKVSTNTYFCSVADNLTYGLKYINGQYTYVYQKEQQGDSDSSWNGIDAYGWGIGLTDRTSTEPVTDKVCTYINNMPIVSASNMFSYSKATSIDVSNFNTTNVINMQQMFKSSEATEIKGLSHFDTSNVTNMQSMFSDSQATTLNLSNFDTNKVTDMRTMFYNSQATTLDVSNFNTSNVTNMESMFSNCQTATLNLSNFDTSNVTTMFGMFYHMPKITTLDLGSFNTSNVTDMGFMFSGNQITAIKGLENFDTSNVTTMRQMFGESIKIEILDLSNFDTNKVTDMDNMFSYCTNLKTIYTSSTFSTNNVTSSNYMFGLSTSLVGGAGTKYDSTKTDKTYARIDGGTSNPGYFTDVADKNIPAPNSFATDSWKTIIKAVRNNNIGKYNVGGTKKVDLGTYGTHTLRVANTSTPSECSRAGFSQTACGFVLEFADIITTHKMNDTNTNVGGWPASSMYTFVNNRIYNYLPSELRNAIIDTTVVSGHGKTSGETNFTSTDKLYLLSTAEVWADAVSSSNGINGIDEKLLISPLSISGEPGKINCDIECDNARDITRQLDYYKNLGITINNYSGAIKKNGTIASYWWLRAARSINTDSFYAVSETGHYDSTSANNTFGVAPAFRLG